MQWKENLNNILLDLNRKISLEMPIPSRKNELTVSLYEQNEKGTKISDYAIDKLPKDYVPKKEKKTHNLQLSNKEQQIINSESPLRNSINFDEFNDHDESIENENKTMALQFQKSEDKMMYFFS